MDQELGASKLSFDLSLNSSAYLGTLDTLFTSSVFPLEIS